MTFYFEQSTKSVKDSPKNKLLNSQNKTEMVPKIADAGILTIFGP